MSQESGGLPERLLAGDEEALCQVRRWVADSLTATRFWRLRDEWKDLQQEALCSIIESLRRERFRPDGEFRNYVWGICRHLALNRLAQRARRNESGAAFDFEKTPDDASTERQMITAQLVRRALDESSEECREMIRAYFLEGATYAELAAQLEVPVGTAKSRLFRCLQCLRRSMAPVKTPRARTEEVIE